MTQFPDPEAGVSALATAVMAIPIISRGQHAKKWAARSEPPVTSFV